MSISVIIPCLNEEQTIFELIQNINTQLQNKIDFEVLVIDDFSSDNTIHVVEKIIKTNNKIKLIKNKKNLGFGGSFKEGLKFSSKEFCITIPGDGETNVDEIFKEINKIYSKDITICYWVGEKRSSFRIFISGLFTYVINFLFGNNLKYYNGACFYNVNKLKNIEIKSNGFFFNAEILIKMIDKKYSYSEIPIFLNPRKYGNSKAIKFIVLLKVIKDILITFYEVKIKK
tara:strand:+ start:128 stop:814 length:687 start_codon:yes stop_codon:yes gene_type:complete